ncbi:MAG TPA: ABC transporter permease [Hyphomicrobiaceae bacterium]|nr:ABC transporter permease [Hyphomicrobiaceae bacterium]
MSQILFLEVMVKLAFGAPLIVAPLSILKLCGLSCPPTGFWPRLVGALLLGLAAATFIEIRLPGSKGLGLYGLIAINLIAAGTIIAMLIMNGGAPTWRGRMALWLGSAMLFTLALAEVSEI